MFAPSLLLLHLKDVLMVSPYPFPFSSYWNVWKFQRFTSWKV